MVVQSARSFGCLALVAIVLSPAPSRAQTQEVTLEALQQQLADLNERVSMLDQRNKSNLRLGGYFVMQGDMLLQDKPKSVVTESSIELIPHVDFNEYWHGLSEIEFVRDTKLVDADRQTRHWGYPESAVNLERSWLEYSGSDSMRVRLGFDHSSFGDINGAHEHPLILTIDRPAYLTSGLVSQTYAGVAAILRSSAGQAVFYTGSSFDDEQAEFKTAPFVGGVRLTYRRLSLGNSEVSLNYQHNARYGKDETDVVGFDGQLQLGSMSFRFESALDQIGQYGLYFQPSITLDQVELFYAYDCAHVTTTERIEEGKVIHKVGGNYLVSGGMRLKLELHRQVYERERDENGGYKDFTAVIGQAAFSF